MTLCKYCNDGTTICDNCQYYLPSVIKKLEQKEKNLCIFFLSLRHVLDNCDHFICIKHEEAVDD